MKYDKKKLTERAWYTAGRMVDWKCPRCGANGTTMADMCAAPIDQPCPGFARTVEVHREYEENRAAIVGE